MSEVVLQLHSCREVGPELDAPGRTGLLTSLSKVALGLQASVRRRKESNLTISITCVAKTINLA